MSAKVYLNLLGEKRSFEVTLDDHLYFQFGPANFAHQRNYPERQRNVFCSTEPEKITKL